MKKSKAFVNNQLRISLKGLRLDAVKEFNKLIYQKKITLKANDQCFCQSNQFEKLNEFDRYGLPFPNQICKNCGLISQVYSISSETIGSFYDLIYWPITKGTTNAKTYFTPTINKDFIDFIQNHIDKSKSNMKIFEIGVGTGSRILSLKKYLEKNNLKFDLYACDYSSVVVENLSKEDVNCVQGGSNSLIKYGEADVLILSHVFEHFTDLKKELEIIDQLSNENTLIYIEVPGVKNLKNNLNYNYDFQEFSVLAHIHNFTLTTLSNVMKFKNFYLLDGSEYIRSVFKKSRQHSENKIVNDFESVTEELLELNKMYQKRINSASYIAISYVKRIVKSLINH
tara:strand:+ start:6722 stop:7741 length:1020 start_codon:yes stop_codon:yes gene_type:complete